MFAQSCRGRAWRGCPKPRRRSWLRKLTRGAGKLVAARQVAHLTDLDSEPACPSLRAHVSKRFRWVFQQALSGWGRAYGVVESDLCIYPVCQWFSAV